jgi:PAS domain S-box-containing protein
VIDDLFEAAPVGLGVFDRDLRWIRANQALAGFTGRRPDEVVGKRPAEVLGPLGPVAEEAIQRVLASGRAEVGEGGGELAEQPGVERHWRFALFPVKGGVGIAAAEITDRVLAERELAEAHRRDALMARAGQLLSTAMSVQETADLTAQLVVPELADWCFVELVRDGGIDRVAWSHRDPDKLALMADADKRYPLDPDSPVGSPKVIRTGEAELIPHIPDEFLVQAAQDERHLEILRELGFRSSLVMPLVARGRILGDIAMVTDNQSDPPRSLGPEIMPLARSLADRCAVALDNAAMYAQRDLVAVTLQEELLPPRLPPIPGIDAAARYSAAGEGNQVGGDFYDVFSARTGWHVIIGDVVGKGPAAAAVTGLARHTLRTAAAYEQSPSRLLQVLNEALLAEHPGRRLASVACVRLEPDGEALRVTVSAGGHPLPLVVGVDGSVRDTGRFGQLLGFSEEIDVQDTEDRLEPGELLVLYTDGVIEGAGASGAFDEAHLRALLADSGGDAPTRVLRRIEGAVLAASGGRPRDDLAMIALRPRPRPTPWAPNVEEGGP